MTKRRIIFIFCLAIFTIVLVFIALPRSPHANGPRFKSVFHLHVIGGAIRDYADSHQQLPKRLSELVPNYVPVDQIGIFYPSSSRFQNISLPVDWTNASQVDRSSSYIYLGTNSVNGVLAYEKTNLWKANATHPGEVAVLWTNFAVQFMPLKQLGELMSGKSGANK